MPSLMRTRQSMYTCIYFLNRMAGSSSHKSKWDKTSLQSLPIPPRILSALRKGEYVNNIHVHTPPVIAICFYYSAGIHHVSSVLEQSTSSLTRRTGLGETEVCGLVLEVSRAVLTTSHSNVMNALNLYNTGLAQYHWGELHML